MQLLYTQRSPYARKVRVVALEKNISLSLVEENLTQKSSQLLAANPLAKIPTLITAEGQSFFDSPMICQYLDSLHQNPCLIPAAQRWSVLRWEALADGLMDNMVGIYLEIMRHPNDSNPRFISNREANSAEVLAYIENHLIELQDLSLASIAIACAVESVNFYQPQLNPAGAYPQLQAWLAVFSQRPSMQTTAPVR
jgi:glutathione S-transferase